MCWVGKDLEKHRVLLCLLAAKAARGWQEVIEGKISMAAKGEGAESLKS